MVMIKAFLSHSSAQKTFVEKVAQILGLDNCFLDSKTFESGMQTIDEIIKAIGKSSIFVFFISKEALESKWVKDELSKVREFVDDGVIRFLPIIIDSNISHDDYRIKAWIRNEYNLQPYVNPVLVARRIKEVIRELSWREFPDLQNKETLFQGRDEELSMLKRKYYDGNMSCRRCLIISGFPPGIGRKKLMTEYIKSEIAPIKSKTYEPILVNLDENSSIEDLLFQLNDIVLFYPHDEVLNINTKDKKTKVDYVVKLLCAIDSMNEILIIRDNGVCVLSNGRLSDWFFDILCNANLPHKICLFVVSSYFVSSKTELALPSLISLKINPLKKDAVRVLFYAYTSLRKIPLISGIDSVIDKIPGLPSYVFRSAELMNITGSPQKLTLEIEKMLKDEEKSYVPIINQLKDTEDVFQLIVLMQFFEFISQNIIERVLAKLNKQNFIYDYLEKLYSYGLFERLGGNNQYLKLNTVVADYIRRNKIPLNTKYKEALDQVLKEYILEGNVAEDLSGYLIGIQNAIRDNIKHVDKKYLVPSFTLKVIIDEYGKKQYERVILLSKRFLEDSVNYYDEIVRSIRYWLCMALCRLQKDEFYEEIDKFNGYSKSFLYGFFHRCKGDYPQALGFYQSALKLSKSNKDANYVAKAKHEIVVVMLKMKDFEGALTVARDNYDKQSTNRYHVEAYFTCIVRSVNPDTILLKRLLDEYKQLVVDSITNTIHQTMCLEYEFYALHDKGVLTKLRRLVAISSKNIRFYPYQVLVDIAKRMNALRTIDDLSDIYKQDLEERDLELEM